MLSYEMVIREFTLQLYRKLESAIFTGLTADALHGIYHEVSTDVLNFLPLVAGADSNHSCATSEPGPDPAWGVFKDDAVGRGEAQLARCKKERIGRRFARLQALVVCGDRHLGRDNPNTRHAPERCHKPMSVIPLV